MLTETMMLAIVTIQLDGITLQKRVVLESLKVAM